MTLLIITMYYFQGFLIPTCLMVSTSYVGCDDTTLAVVLFSLALGLLALNTSSYNVNHLDIAPRYAGVLMGITNSAATIPGMIGPYVVGYLTNNEVSYFDLNFYSFFPNECIFVFINPLNSKSDILFLFVISFHLFLTTVSSNTAESLDKIMRIKEMITNLSSFDC